MVMISTLYKIKSDLKKTYRIAVASDIHDIPCDAVLRDIADHKPDFITIPGDIIYWRSLKGCDFDYDPDIPLLPRFPEAERFIREIPKIAPSFFSYGNHEWLLRPADALRIQEAGVTVLDNSWTGFGEFAIGGLSAPFFTNYKNFSEEWRGGHPEDLRWDLINEYAQWHTPDYRKTVESSWLADFEEQAGYKVLLCHQPEYWAIMEPFLKNHQIDLVIAGHAHGGQIRIGNQGLFAPAQGILPKYTAGIHEGNYGSIVISKGLSNHVKVPRLFNPCEMVYIDLVNNDVSDPD